MSQFSPDDAHIIEQFDAKLARNNSNALGTVVALAMVVLTGTALWMMVSSRTQTAIAATAPVNATPLNAAPILWYYRFEQAQEIARAANKPIFIQFYTDWCPACKRMDAGPLQDPWIREQAQNMVSLKVNAEGQPALAKRFGVKVYPTSVWVNAAGQEIGRRDGSGSVRELWEQMKNYR